MPTIARRLLLLVALMVWQGGFMFYGGVVVGVGAEVLGSHVDQGFITQRVTNYLNMAGAVALLIWAWDFLAAGGAGRWGNRLRWPGWGFLVASLLVLVAVHPRLDRLLDADSHTITDRGAYRRLHQAYLGTSSLQWAAALALLAWTVHDWRWQDGGLPREVVRPGRTLPC